MSARDEAITYACDLFSIIFKRLWLPFGERERLIVTKFVDFVIAAVAESIGPQREVEDELDDLADDRLFELEAGRTPVRLPR
jgi:hypothetical protein